MRVLAFDPGYDRLGVAVLEQTGQQVTLLYSACITTDKTTTLPDRLLVLGLETSKLLKDFSPNQVAIETLFFNTNQKTALGVAQARGIIIYLAKVAGVDIVEFGPQEIKVAITGYGKSDKTAVISMVQRLIANAPQSAHDDEFDAIAVGITALAHHR